jgi:hypothetical protein
MKPHILITLAALAFIATFSTVLQCQEQLLFRVNVPFNFTASGVQLSAGEYLAFHTTPTTIQLVRKDGKGSVWVAVKPSPVRSGGSVTQIVFNRYGGTYFLSQVHTGADQQIHECYKCHAEKVLIAQNLNADVETIALNTMSAK